MTMSANDKDKKEVLFERRETSLLGNVPPRPLMVDKAVQSEIISMDLGKGDSYSMENDSSYTNDTSYSNDTSYNSDTYSHSNQDSHRETYTPIYYSTNILRRPALHRARSKENILRAASVENLEVVNHVTEIDGEAPPVSEEAPPPSGEAPPPLPSSEEPVTEEPITKEQFGPDNNKSPPSFSQAKAISTERLDATLKVNETKTKAVVEDSSKIVMTEANPSVPVTNDESRTLRMQDRQRSESEDDIEKLEENDDEVNEIDGKVKAPQTGNKHNSDDLKDKNFRGSFQPLEEESDGDCAVQCLYYTIQCCECTIV